MSDRPEAAAERAALGAMLKCPACIPDVRQALTYQDFYSDAHQWVFRALCELADEGKPADAVTAAERLIARGWQEHLGGAGPAAALLLELADACPSPAAAPEYAAQVRRESQRRTLGREARSLAALCDDRRAPLEHLQAEAARIAAAEPARPARAAPALGSPYVPLPVDELPLPIARLAHHAGAALGCDPAYVALPALAICAGMIGNSRSVRLRKDWTEPCVLWTAVVGDSGTLKTPAYHVAMTPVYELQTQFRQEYKESQALYDGSAFDDAQPGPKPTLRRAFAADVTIERLAEIVEDNPRGLLVSRDELRGWFGSFSRYRSAGADSDLSNWLSAYNAGPIVYDRKTGERRSVFVERGNLSVTGTIQPSILARCLTDESFESGLAARLLLAWPDRRRKRWTEAEIPDEVLGRYRLLLRRLLDLRPRPTERGDQPDRLRLTEEARRVWVEWYEEWAQAQHDVSGDLLAAYSKLEGAAARLALVHHVVTMVDLESDGEAQTPVCAASMHAGVALARWFAREAARIYAAVHESDEDRARRRLVQWVQAHGGRVTVTQLQRSNGRLYATADVAREALDALTKLGWGRFEPRQPGPHGGRPTEEFVLTCNPCPTHDETDETSDACENQGSREVSSGGGGVSSASDETS
jgi:hypothetical protein